VVMAPPVGKVDRDLPTFIRERQKDSGTRSPRGMSGYDEEYDIPTFLRKRVD
jgi:cell division protein FtsZ